jgi:iron complex outermembrane receptor protein
VKSTTLMKTTRYLTLVVCSPLASLPVLAQSPEIQGAGIESGKLEALVVTASPLERTLFELVQPATVVDGRNLLLEMETSLGETLGWQAGVSSTSFAPGASRPIIRGLGDDRLRILQNGTSAIDASNVSPDHAVALDPLAVRSVEVVRGPASLLYGPNAIGGVVNVMDDRIPEQRLTRPAEGAVDARYGTVDDLESLSGAVNFGAGPFVFHLDGFTRESGNMKIPGFARSRRLREEDPQLDEPRGILPNSFSESEGGALGGSYIWEGGFVGLSYSGLNSLYGVVAEEDVTIDLEQRRWDLRGAFTDPSAWLKEVNYKLSFSDYEHTEFEGDEVGTVFRNKGFNARSEFLHQAVGRMEGAVGVEVQQTDFAAIGEEAFVPSVESQSAALFFFEEMDLDPVRLQFGARIDRQTHETADLERSFNALSTSAGVVYTPAPDYAVALAVGYSERPPTYVELFADGIHVATGLAEVGDPNLRTEDSFSMDLSLRKKVGRITGSASAFYYRFSNFISLDPTGDVVDDEGEEFPEYAFGPVRADFYGGELEAVFHLLEPLAAGDHLNPRRERLDLSLRTDYVHAENRDNGEAMPRIPPFRTALALDYQREAFGARLEGQWAARQNRHSEAEFSTDSYFLVNLALTYELELGKTSHTLFLKGMNLTDEEARQSTSFLKEIAPLAGRGLLVGVRTEF